MCFFRNKAALCMLHWFINPTTIMIHLTSNWRSCLTVKCEKTFSPGLLISQLLDGGISPHLSFQRPTPQLVWSSASQRECLRSSPLFNNANDKRDMEGWDRPRTSGSSPQQPVSLGSRSDCRDEGFISQHEVLTVLAMPGMTRSRQARRGGSWLC